MADAPALARLQATHGGKSRITMQVTYSLDALVAEITPKNLHAEVSFGRPVGKESI